MHHCEVWEKSGGAFFQACCHVVLGRLLEQGHAPYVETVPFKAVAAFTIFQLIYLLMVYGITWIPIAGFLFPLPIIALIPIRSYLLPKVCVLTACMV
jgi:hypothetical protein